jgi:hypothetical protein
VGANCEMLLVALEDRVHPVIGPPIDPCFKRFGMYRRLLGKNVPAFDIGGDNNKNNDSDGGKEKPPGMAHTSIYMVTRVKIGIYSAATSFASKAVRSAILSIKMLS